MTHRLVPFTDPGPMASERGIGLLEVLVALGIGALLTASAAPSLGDFVQGRRIDGVAARFVGDLQLARSETLLRSVPVRVSFYATASGSCYLLHTGPHAACSCLPSGIGHCTGTDEPIRTVALPAVDHVWLQADVASIAFEPLHGTCTPTGTVDLRTDSGRAVRHMVNILGRVRSCTPVATPGYPPC